MTQNELQDLSRRAAEAHSNINTFHAVILLMEAGMIYGKLKSGAEQEKIIKLAKQASGKAYREYEAATRKLGEVTAERDAFSRAIDAARDG